MSSTQIAVGVGVLVLVGVLAAAIAAPAEAAELEIQWLGHAAFKITSPKGTQVLVDPFISQNPKTPKALKDLKKYRPDAILITHAHGDHVGDMEVLAKASGAKVIGAADYIRSLTLPKPQKLAGNVGGKLTVKDVTVHLVPAMHGSQPGGRPLGFVIEMDGKRIYHTGDTWIFGDMALIEEIYHPDVVLLQAGGGPYNQDPKVARLAIDKYFKSELVVPMHYGTWPVLATEAEVKAAFEGLKSAKILQPGQTVSF